MIKCKIIALGSLKEKYLREASKEYEKRLSRFCNLEICEIDPVKLSDKPSDLEIEGALKKETEFIKKKIPQNSKVFALCVEGKPFTSEMFAKEIKESISLGTNFCFIIGSSYGMSQEIKKMADIRLSLSEMTFPHQLFRIMLLEQIYRAFKINEGSTYHK